MKNVTPQEVWSGHKPSVLHLKVFHCCIAMAHIPKQKRQKFNCKSEECIFVGYAVKSKGYRLMKKDTHEVILRKDVIFVENKMNSETKEAEERRNLEIFPLIEDQMKIDVEIRDEMGEEDNNIEQENNVEQEQNTRHSVRQKNPKKFENFIL